MFWGRDDKMPILSWADFHLKVIMWGSAQSVGRWAYSLLSQVEHAWPNLKKKKKKWSRRRQSGMGENLRKSVLHIWGEDWPILHHVSRMHLLSGKLVCCLFVSWFTLHSCGVLPFWMLFPHFIGQVKPAQLSNGMVMTKTMVSCHQI